MRFEHGNGQRHLIFRGKADLITEFEILQFGDYLVNPVKIKSEEILDPVIAVKTPASPAPHLVNQGRITVMYRRKLL
jgi:hypothetical protein